MAGPCGRGGLHCVEVDARFFELSGDVGKDLGGGVSHEAEGVVIAKRVYRITWYGGLRFAAPDGIGRRGRDAIGFEILVEFFLATGTGEHVIFDVDADLVVP